MGTTGTARRPRRPHHRRWASSLAVSVVLALTGLLGAAGPASAHAELVSSTPANGASLAASPRQVVLRLSESVELSATHVTVTDSAGHDVPVSSVAVQRGADTEQPATVVVGLPHLGPGQYRLSWTTLSSDDLHVTAGVMVFGIGQRVEGAGDAAEPRPSAGEAALRWAGLLGIGLALGASLLLVLLGHRQRQWPLLRALRARLLAASLVGGVVGVVAGAAMPVAQASRAPGAAGPVLRRLLLHETYGAWWWVHETALLVLVGVAVLSLRGRSGPSEARRTVLVAATGTAAVVSTVLMGHAGARPSAHVGLVAVESLHALSALTWTGAVVAAALVLVRRVPGEIGLPSVRVLVLRTFGVVAAVCAAVAGVTGLVLAGHRVATPDALLHSVYGGLLLVKLAVVAVVAGLGLVNTLLLRPGRLPHRLRHHAGGRLTGRTVVGEAAVVLLLVAATAVLSAAAPATGQRWQPQHATRPASAQADDLVQTLQVLPNRPGTSFLTLSVFDTRRPSPGAPQAIVVALTAPDGSRTSRPAAASADGSWVVPGQQLTPGRWSARVSTRRPGLPTAHATFRWVVPDPAGRPVTGAAARPLSGWTGPTAVAVLVAALLGAALLAGLRRRQAANDAATDAAAPPDVVVPATRPDRAMSTAGSPHD